jgi:beta-glucosidase
MHPTTPPCTSHILLPLIRYWQHLHDSNFGYLLQDTVVNGVRVNEHVNVQGRHAELIREIGAASTVLLKNVNRTLPLVAKSIRRVGVFGSE